MTIAERLQQRSYVEGVIAAYIALPGTPRRANPNDRKLAAELYRRRVPLPSVERALVLAIARRLARPHDAAPLPPIRSLAYFCGAIDETLDQPIDPRYVRHLSKTIAAIDGRTVENAAPERSSSAAIRRPSSRRHPCQLTIPFDR